MPDNPPPQGPYMYGPPPGMMPQQPAPAAAAPAGGAQQTAPAAFVGSLNQGILRSVM